MNRAAFSVRSLLSILAWIACFDTAEAEEIFVRASQIGYEPKDEKLAMAFSHGQIPKVFRVTDEAGKELWSGKVRRLDGAKWGDFENHAELDFGAFQREGRFVLKVGEAKSLPVLIARKPFLRLPDELLEFMREQRCGENPWLSAKCHTLDGRTAYGPMTNGTYLDATGGWHDAADLLKYLLTSSNATAQMLLAYLIGDRAAFGDVVDFMGKPGANGVPDVLDEAKWGLEWMLKLHPAPRQLYHQVADDRDHAGMRLPQNEVVDYGWGKGGARVVYFADGKPQGLMEYKSESDGIANLAGRYAAAMAMAFQVWNEFPGAKEFAKCCLMSGIEVYEMGRKQEGVQQGNSYKSPYRYAETTWADDMEWGAVELYRATRESRYLREARQYAKVAGAESWMGKEQTGHYQYYPFVNVGHFRLHDLVEKQMKNELALYYREGIECCLAAGEKNPYRVGVPFIWCSDNLVVALVTQCEMYERMTGDRKYRSLAAKQRDWLVGRNPWGYTMFTDIGAVSPQHPHLMTKELTGRSVRGGLVDGPVYSRIFNSLKGVSITEPDPLAKFQGEAVYHDDVQDYSSNEPTMDGTASGILMWAIIGK